MATKTKPKTAKRTKTSKKKPSWSVVTFKQIEARRVELGLSKSAMARSLGITNSTYHNWQRGTTVPHPNQQEQIVMLMGTLAPGKATTPKATRQKAAATSKGKKALRTVRRTTGDVVGGASNMPSNYTETHPLYPAETPTVRGIAQITSAWITSQSKAPSAGSVFEFVDGLKDVLKG